tara:strand:- start:12 stop:1631 length:1620 start_codon:yes stop_codon:yes gene_type:complete
VFNTSTDKAYAVPLLEGFSFSQSTNSSEITLSEMESTTGDSRRGRKMFNDSLAPVEWSFSTYLRPYLAASSGATSWADGKQHLVDEPLWNSLLAKSRIGDVGTTTKRVDRINVTNAGSGYTSVPTVAVAAPAAVAIATSDVSTANNTLTDSGDFFLVGDKVTYSNGGGTSITGLTSGNQYFVVSVATGGVIKLSETSGGAVINLTGTGNNSQTLTGETATAEAVVTQSTTSSTRQTVEAVNVIFGGSGYAAAPSVSFSGGGGSSAAATAVLGQSEDAIKTRGGDVNTPLVMDSSRSNKSALNTMTLEFNMGSDLIYKLNKAVCNSATINFDVDGIATVEWSGMAATITAASSHTAAAKTVTEGGTSADTENFIRNRLTAMSIAPVDGGSSEVSPFNASYDLTLTGGSVSIENNISYLTPEELGVVNKPIEHVTGVRNIGGSFTCYLASGTGGSKEFFEDLVSTAGLDIVTHDFAITFKVGGSSETPRVEFTMPHCHVEVPSHSIEDVVSLETTFSSLQSNMESKSADDLTITSYGVALS